MQRAEDFQAYLQTTGFEFEKMLKAGGIDMKIEYGKVIESFYWAVQGKQADDMNDAEPDEVLASERIPV